jgi:hypothetical protein
MGMLKIESHDGRTAFAPGEAIAGAASWSFDAPPDAVELRVIWYTQGKGTQDVGVVETVRYDAPGREDFREFKIRLPESPYSFSGRLVSLLWALELVAQPSGESARFEFVLGPGGKEIVLPEPPPAKSGPDGPVPGFFLKIFRKPAGNPRESMGGGHKT